MKFEVLKQSNLKRNIIIGVTAVLIISTIILTFTKAKYRVTESIPLVNGTINYSLADLNAVAIYINTADGYIKSDTVPESGYVLNEEESYCMVNGAEDTNIALSYNVDTKSLSVSPITTKGTKCYLYFDEEPNAAGTIEDLYEDNQDMLAYDDYGNLRYIGVNPNNYVSFNDELWRIIGVFNEDTHSIGKERLIKIIRNESLGNFAWDSANTNNWSTASLQTTLNGDYLNGSGSYTSTGITSDARKMIENVTWKLGGTELPSVYVDNFYIAERGTTVSSGRPTEWTGKVGLMYPSDYGYATEGGETIDRNTCLTSTVLNSWSYYKDCGDNSWLLLNSSYDQWTITPLSSYSDSVFTIFDIGQVGYSDSTFTMSVHPSVYLKSNVDITSGDGTSTKPYQLQLT